MELALNAIWFFVVVVGYTLLWRSLSARSSDRCKKQFNAATCTVALALALAILFPVISLSDDLQDLSATVEDTAAARVLIKKQRSDAGVMTLLGSHRGATGFVLPGKLRLSFTTWRRPHEVPAVTAMQAVERPQFLRPPPGDVAA